MKPHARFCLALLLVAFLATCSELEGDPAAEPPPAPHSPPTGATEWVERSKEVMQEKVRAFDLTELVDGTIVRRGRLISYPTAGQKTVDLTWEGDGGTTRLRSDGTTVYAQSAAGDVSFSPWSEAGSVLFQDAAGRLVGAALDPSSFAAYGASLTQDGDGGDARVEAALPGGGSWTVRISGASYLPRAVGFRAAAAAAGEELILEPVAEFDAVPPADLRLEANAGRTATRFYAGPAPGDPAPAVSFTLADGTTVALSDLVGSVVVVDFWATWCAPCRPAMKALDELYRKHRQAGLEVYGLRLFDSGDPTAYLESLGITYPTGDGAPFVESYALSSYGLPTLYVIDRAGNVAHLIVGFSAETEEILARAVENALAT